MTIARRRKKLEAIARGNGLSDAHTATLIRLRWQKRGKSVLGLKVLMWVAYAERPLRAEELCHALAVEMRSTDVDPNNVPGLRTLLASCLGLVVVEASSSTVRLVHFTLQQYLLSHSTLFHSPHSTIAEVCLTYLNFGTVRGLSSTLRSAPATLPFLEYASLHWGKHTRLGMTENVKMLALRLLGIFDEHISAQLLLSNYDQDSRSSACFPSKSRTTGFTGLHGVSSLGIAVLVVAVLEMKEWDVNATDCTGSTALIWAARRGHEEVVKVLLERGDINPDQADTKYGRTPLSRAAENGHEGVVKFLLEQKGVNPDQPDRASSRTPLSWAAGNGHEGVVKMLLEREDVNTDHEDTLYGQTPLSWAAEKGHEGVVKMLLEREDVQPDHVDTKYGQTPLWRAAQNGHLRVVKMLLTRRGVDSNRVDTDSGQTPLTRAAGGGHEGVVKILLERGGADPNMADTKTGRTPLSWAASCGRAGVVKILLERKDVHTTTPDNENQIPVALALSNGHHEVAKILVDSADSHTADRSALLSLPPSTRHGQVGAVEIQSRNLQPNTSITDPNPQPALSPAPPNQQEGIPDPKDTLLKRTGGGLSSTDPPQPPQPPSTQPLESWSWPRKTDPRLNIRLAPPSAANRYLAVAFFIGVFAFLIYILPSLLPHIFLFHK